MLKAASEPALMATDLAEKLVELKVPFRRAHHQVGALVKWCDLHGKKLNEVTLEEMRETIPAATEEFLTMFDPRGSIARREMFGATGFKAVRQQIDFWLARLPQKEN